MSKVDAQRAMREARFAAYRAKVAAQAAAPAAKPTRTAAVLVGPVPADVPAAPLEPADPLAADSGAAAPDAAQSATPGLELCGHRNMGNKSCRRPAGHAEKSHRYK